MSPPLAWNFEEDTWSEDAVSLAEEGLDDGGVGDVLEDHEREREVERKIGSTCRSVPLLAERWTLRKAARFPQSGQCTRRAGSF